MEKNLKGILTTGAKMDKGSVVCVIVPYLYSPIIYPYTKPNPFPSSIQERETAFGNENGKPSSRKIQDCKISKHQKVEL